MIKIGQWSGDNLITSTRKPSLVYVCITKRDLHSKYIINQMDRYNVMGHDWMVMQYVE